MFKYADKQQLGLFYVSSVTVQYIAECSSQVAETVRSATLRECFTHLFTHGVAHVQGMLVISNFKRIPGP